MYKELAKYYNYRMSSLLYILDNTKTYDADKKCKSTVLNQSTKMINKSKYPLPDFETFKKLVKN